MVDKIIKLFKNARLTSEKGAFLSDKSYKYDTLFFVTKYILDNCENKKYFSKKDKKLDCVKYIEKTFSLKENSTVSINYLTEVLNLLLFSNLMEKIEQDKYLIKNYKILKWIVQSIENSYIFLFLMTYMTLKNEQILDVYYQYINSKTRKEKEFYLSRLFELITSKSKRVTDPNSVWGKLTVKYPLMVLGLFYKENSISKGLNIQDDFISPASLAMNVSGTKTSSDIVKDNEYIFHFRLNYINKILKRFNIKKAN